MSEDLTTWLKHPLVNMVIGFLLTGVLGTAITQHFLNQREQERLRAQFALDTKQAIQQFAKLNEDRKVRSSTCSPALAAGVSDLAGTRSEWVSTEEIEELQKRARDSIGKQCP